MLYLAVTSDKYELPIACESSAQELAKKFGVSSNLVSSSISKGLSGRYNGIKFVKCEELEESEVD